MSLRGAGKWLAHPALGAFCRLLLGAIFIYAAVPKLLRPDVFARLVNGYQILHPDLANLAGITMPWIELVAGASLVLGILPQSSAAVIAGLLCLFIGAGSLALLRGLHIECGCFFPIGGDKLTWATLLRDAVLLVLALQALVWPTSFIRYGRKPRPLL
jgi:putative oxidoreductase